MEELDSGIFSLQFNIQVGTLGITTKTISDILVSTQTWLTDELAVSNIYLTKYT